MGSKMSRQGPRVDPGDGRDPGSTKQRSELERVVNHGRGCIGHHEAGHGGPAEVAATERGTFFGYGDLVVDFRAMPRMRAVCDAPVIFDATHSVQQPGRGEGGTSGGAREFIPALTLAACAVGVDGLFMETHPDPAHAPSDGPNMMPLDKLDDLIRRAVDVWECARR